MNRAIELLRQQTLLNNRLVSHTFELTGMCHNATRPDMQATASKINALLNADDKSAVDLVKLTTGDKIYYLKTSDIIANPNRISVFQLNYDLADLEFVGFYHNRQLDLSSGA